MTNENQDLDQVLEEKISDILPEDTEIEEVEEESTENSEEKEEITSEEPTEEVEEESTEEVDSEAEENIDSEKVDLDKDLSGFKKEFRDLVKSIDDQELQSRLIEAGKLERADLDRKRLELGESNKLSQLIDGAVKDNGLSYNKSNYPQLIENYLKFDAMFSRDPKGAIKLLATQSQIDLNDFVENKATVEDSEDDYRTPEEIARDDEIKQLKERLHKIEHKSTEDAQISAQQEIESFKNTKDDNGELKYPYFDQVRNDMQVFFNGQYPDMTLEKAYNKALLLNDEFVQKRDADILAKAEQKRKAEIEKAKKLHKQSSKSRRTFAKSDNPDENLKRIVKDFGF